MIQPFLLCYVKSGNRMATRTFREKTQQQSRVFFEVIFYVYTHVDNRERAGARDEKRRRPISLEKNMKISQQR